MAGVIIAAISIQTILFFYENKKLWFILMAGILIEGISIQSIL